MATKLTSSFQYICRSDVMNSVSGGLKYYLLLFAKTSPNETTGIHTVTIVGRLASTSANATFYKYATSYSGKINGSTAFSGSGRPSGAWDYNSSTGESIGGVNYKTYVDIASGSVNVDCTNGLAKDITISFTWSMPSNDSDSYTPVAGTTRTASATVTLAAIPRASEPTCNATATMGSSLTIKTNRLSTSFTHTLKYTFGGTTETIATGVGDSYPWSVPDMAHLCNNKLSDTCKITCITYNGSTKIGEEYCTLTVNVPGATVPSFQNGDVMIGAGNPITTNAGSANFTHLVSYAFNGMTGDVNSDKVKSGIVWWTPYDLAKTIKASPSGNGTITCKTYNGTALVGTSSPVSFKAIVPDNEITKPSFSVDGFVLTPDSKLPSAFDGLYIQGKTGVKAEFTATSTYSDIASYKMSVDGRVYTGNPATSTTLTKDGNIEVVGTVTDARGYYKQVPKTISVVFYKAPSIDPYEGDNSIVCERSDANGDYTPAGTHLHIRAKRSYSTVSADGTQKNFCDMKYRFKASEGTWSEARTLMEGSDTTKDMIDIILDDVVTETDKTYAVQLIVEDTVGESIPYDFTIPTDKVTLHLGYGGHGVAVGMYSQASAGNELFESDWDAKFYKDVIVDGDVLIGENKTTLRDYILNIMNGG